MKEANISYFPPVFHMSDVIMASPEAAIGERIYHSCIYFPLLHGFSIHGESVWPQEEDSLAFPPVVQYYY